ncbi:hypothetical protein [Palleronia sp.]|uniref:hypothetical protein n=1 Tax=Palleronia sp. TaxID=1940284 RepID=UPI0035C84E9A
MTERNSKFHKPQSDTAKALGLVGRLVLDDVSDLADLTYDDVAAGYHVEAGGNRYLIVEADAADEGLVDYTGSGGVKMRRLPSRRTDNTPDLRVKNVDALASPAIIAGAADGDVAEVAKTGHRFVKDGAEFLPLETPEHSISLAQYDIDRTGTVNVSDALRRALDRADTLGGGEILLPPGRLLLGDVQVPGNVTLRGMGSSIYDYTGAFGRTVLVREPDASAILLFRDQILFVRDVDFDGNGGQSAGFGHGIDCEGSLDVEVQNVKMIDHHYGIEGGLAKPVGGLDVRFSVLRNNNVGVNNCRDSFLLRSTFSANREIGLYLNGGQITVMMCFLEFQRGGANLDERADAIFLGRNANEVLIEGTTFDRNTGYDVFGEEATVDGELKFPQYINMVGNTHKGGAWGTDLAPSDRRAIRFENGDHINVTSALGQTRTSEPSPSKGAPSPLFSADLGRTTNVTIDAKGLSGITSLIEFDSSLGEIYEWVESSASGEWYLRDNGNYGEGGKPYLDAPDFMAVDGTSLAQGTLGALAHDEYAFGDNDGLGYNTLYVRVAGDPTGQDPVISYTGDPIRHESALVSYGGYRSVIPPQSVPANGSVDIVLHGKDMSRSTFISEAIELVLTVRQSSTANAVASAYVILQRNDGIECMARVEGTFVKAGGMTVGTAGSGSALELSAIGTSRLGETVTIQIMNTTTMAIKISGGSR